MPTNSTRFKLLLVAILVAAAKEIAAHYGVEIPLETFLAVEGTILGLMGLDTARPLGRGYPEDPASEAPALTEESPESSD